MSLPISVDPLRPKQSRIWATFKRLIRARITAGLAVVLPIWVTYLLVKFVFGLMRDASLWLVEGLLRSRIGVPLLESLGVRFEVAPETGQPILPAGIDWLPQSVQWGIEIFSVLLTIFALYFIGLLTANIFGRRTLEGLEQLVDRVPLVKTVYRSSKQILTTFTTGQTQTFQRVALIPFLTDQVRSIGFITNIFRDAQTGEELCTIFYATTPNPTTGFVLIVKRADIIELDWTIEEAVKAVMSGGILMPRPVSLVTAALAADVVATARAAPAVSPPPAAPAARR
ncbi:MAG: DUF502 domain-containing protein, partial [Dongiaceae bacterium]